MQARRAIYPASMCSPNSASVLHRQPVAARPVKRINPAPPPPQLHRYAFKAVAPSRTRLFRVHPLGCPDWMAALTRWARACEEFHKLTSFFKDFAVLPQTRCYADHADGAGMKSLALT